MPVTNRLRPGLYESVVDRSIRSRMDSVLDAVVDVAGVDPAEHTHVLTRHVAAALRRRLEAERDPVRKLDVANDVLAFIESNTADVEPPLRELHAVRREAAPGEVVRYSTRPKTPLNDASLLTNAHGEPSLASELKAEIDSADTVDRVCP